MFGGLYAKLINKNPNHLILILEQSAPTADPFLTNFSGMFPRDINLSWRIFSQVGPGSDFLSLKAVRAANKGVPWRNFAASYLLIYWLLKFFLCV
jgi:hypothetical protein